MKFKIIFGIIIMILLSGYIFRFIYINKKLKIYDSITKEYDFKETVLFENDFFYNSSESANGYSITTLDISYLKINDLKKIYKITEDPSFDNCKYIYIIKVRFKNDGNNLSENIGINIKHLILQKDSFIAYPNTTAFKLLNNFNYSGFSLSPGKEQEFMIPFVINDDFVNIDDLINGNGKLVISLYPNKKTIQLKRASKFSL